MEPRKLLPQTAEYGLRAVVWLARESDGTCSADAIAAGTQVPRRYLHKVLQAMVRAGLVRSQPGPQGGYALDRPTQEITMLDVVNATGPIERIQKCPLGLKSHERLCPLHKKLNQAFEAVEDAFRSVTIAEIIESTDPIIPLLEVGLPDQPLP